MGHSAQCALVELTRSKSNKRGLRTRCIAQRAVRATAAGRWHRPEHLHEQRLEGVLQREGPQAGFSQGCGVMPAQAVQVTEGRVERGNTRRSW